MKLIISILVLFAPLIWELIDDANGEVKRDKTPDVFIRILLAICAGLVNFILIGKAVLDSFILSMAIHFFFFDYIIHFILIRKGIVETKETWFTYLGKSAAMDNWNVWRKLKPWSRFSVKLVVLLFATLMYIL